MLESRRWPCPLQPHQWITTARYLEMLNINLIIVKIMVMTTFNIIHIMMTNARCPDLLTLSLSSSPPDSSVRFGSK